MFSLMFFCARESAPENGSLRRDQDKALRKYHGLLAKQEQLLRGRLCFFFLFCFFNLLIQNFC